LKASVNGTKPILGSASSLQGGDQIRKRAASSVEASDEDRVHLAAAGSGKKLLPLWPLQSASADLLNLGSNLPTAANSILPHRLDLKRER
jgi:hypothetical protein